MATRLSLLLLLLAGCATVRQSRARDYIAQGDPEAAVALWTAHLRNNPDDKEGVAGLKLAWAAVAEVGTARARTASSVEDGLAGLQQVHEARSAGAAEPVGFAAVRADIERKVHAQILEPLGLGQPLVAWKRLALLEPSLRAAGLDAAVLAEQKAIFGVGARRCAVLSGSTRTPHLASFVSLYCARFLSRGPQVAVVPERRGNLLLDVSQVRVLNPQAKYKLIEAAQSAFKASVWSDPRSSSVTEARLSGALESRIESMPIEATTTWFEDESYTTTETVTENYQESYMASESRSHQVPYTATESYTYSCYSGTSYSSCTGYRSVTRYRTEYRTEQVQRTRPATRQVTRSVQKTRAVARSFQFPAVQKTAKHAGQLMLAVALPGTVVPFEWKWSDRDEKSDTEHDVTNPKARLTPHKANVTTSDGWESQAAAALENALRVALDAEWVKSFCTTAMTPEQAARCAAAKGAPAEAWAVLAQYFGEPVERLRELVAGYDGGHRLGWLAMTPDFSAVYESQAAFTWRSLRRLGVPEADVQDASQEVFVVVHRKLPEFAGRSSMKTWVFGICLRVASDWRKRAHIKREAPMEEAPARTTSGETPTREIAMKQARQKLDLALAQLDEDKRAVFVLFEMEELSMAEVAEAVGCPVQTAYARLYAARKFIESWLAQLSEVPS